LETNTTAQDNVAQIAPTLAASPLTEPNTTAGGNEPKTFIPGHRGGMSSMERIETELFSALGEETSSFVQDLDPTTADNGGLSGLEDFESPVAKRKRKNSEGRDRLRSPKAKIMREEKGDVGGQLPGLSQLRGD
jgi:hypothetical protein